ncbi:MAG: Crp/Fnr family transcriptional regulator [Pyrinomonadaceae bacterium]|nr:Crp/Fnr family transcriptional regulator [Pyrinomonadaceae bacterium]MBP6211841.1 Crp/Fnr family transcriptional regulator [Pyrinomonadaceae bacterium]
MPKKDTTDEALLNQLLAALPESEYLKIRPSLERVELERGQVLWEAEELNQHIYFPATAMICMLYETVSGQSIEVGMIGRNGLVGIATFMGDADLLHRVVVERSGSAFRMKGSDALEEFSESGDFQDILMCYTQSLITQISQTAVCNQLHSVDQQLCRWLLMNHDHQQTSVFLMTHDQIASLLGVRRESVSLAASHLQDRGLIKCTRGKIELVDRDGLEASSCECYGIVKMQYDRMLSKYIKAHGD